MSRRVVFPLKVKLISIMTGLLVGSISLYAVFALNLFEKDKSAYIYGNSSEANRAFNERLTDYLDNSFERLQTLSFVSKDNLQNILSRYGDIFHLDIYSQDGGRNSYFNLNNIEDLGLSINEYKEITSSYDHKSIKHFSIVKDEISSFLILKYSDDIKKQTLIMFLKMNIFESISSSFSQYHSYILDMNGNILFSKESNKSYIKDIEKSKLDEATIEVDDTRPRILSYKINSKYSLIFVTEILKSDAYQVNDYLVNKSKVFGVVLLSLSGFIALLFSRSLTSPLEKLYELTLSISKGDFQNKIQVKSRDEIGALSDSFNYMSDEILRYMDEMKEKARLESEIETAKYVQSTYFPSDSVKVEGFSISSFYRPASECGGDWWGYVETDKTLTVVISDATGHGVPAALLTATAHCCLENLKYNGEDILRSPAKVLEFMNSSIQCLDGKMLMTAFCCVFIKDKQDILFSNASHNPPLYRGYSIDSSKKNNFQPLLGKVGPRLGHKEFGGFVDERISSDKVERILLFTDGVIESKNREGKEFGQRRFLKSLNKYISLDNDSFRRSVVDEAFSFYDEYPIDDDITLVSISLDNDEHLSSIDISDKTLEEELKNNFRNDKSLLITDKPFNSGETFFISSRSDEENIKTLKNNPKIKHLVGRNSSNIIEEINHNFTNALSGLTLGEYLGDMKFHNTTVRSKEDFDKINNLLGTLDVDGYFESPIDYLKIISNELLTNAIYHSGEGDTFSRRTSMERREIPDLKDCEIIDYSLAVGMDRIAICVVDFTGKLTREVIINNLERSFREREHQDKKGGAGLGLYLAFSYSNQFIVRTDPGKSTEVICVIEKNKRFKNYKERITSFHYFEEEEKV